MTTLLLTEDQELLRASCRDVLAGAAAGFRRARDAGQVYDRELWAQLVDLGWPAIPFAEADGGLGMGLPEVAVVMEELGASLAATPMLSAVACARLSGAWGAQVGEVTALAWRECARGRGRGVDPGAVSTTVRGGRLYGQKRGVVDGNTAGAFVVSAMEGDNVALYRVQAADVVVRPMHRLDHRDAADIVLDGAVGERVDGGLAALQEAIAWVDVASSAEQLGAMSALFQRTIAWLKERRQFGVPIGSFQVLQHRAVDLFIQIELCRSAVLQAAREPTPTWVDLARLQTAEVGLVVAKEAIQMHGGVGMTDELDVGLYAKRAMVAAFG